MFSSLSDIEKRVKSLKKQKRLVLAASEDAHALMAVKQAREKGIIQVILVGDKTKTLEIAKSLGINLDGIEIHHEPDNAEAVERSVKMISDGSADILMKGKSSTATLLKGILNKEWGMRKGKLLSHFALFEIPSYHKLLALTDVAINMNPDLKDKVAILENSVAFMNGLGWEKPKVAIIAAVEVVNEAMIATVDAANIKELSSKGELKNCIVDGPMALDSAINKDSAIKKNVSTEVGGDADLLLFPQLESGNVMYKSLAFLAGGLSASVVLGASAPIVLTSRADSNESKLNSIILAAADGAFLNV